ncbi:S1C family serine protease [Hathewaya limosa]|uniref:S1-C subfamily serine protease n=1 Tax=Hathewaya limosa TaxID=1536 RepID=A0ABU0JNF8_HATLI|nr:S1C family serine protease [Hathewaya limosa]MDQ0478589.1 S1-C subfamily serine protease [Hathewaya limosa]
MRLKTGLNLKKAKIKEVRKQNIEFRKSNTNKCIKYFSNVTIIITLTVSSSILIISYFKTHVDYNTNIREIRSESLGQKSMKYKFSPDASMVSKYNSNYDKFFNSMLDKSVIIESKNVKELGLILKSNGYIITRANDLPDKNNILVSLSNGQRIKGEFIGEDSLTGIAVIKINKENLKTISFRNIEKCTLAGNIIILEGDEQHKGNFLGNMVSIEKRLFSNLNIKGNKKFLVNFIQTGISNNKNLKGGTIICDEDGKVLGINFQGQDNSALKDCSYNALHPYEIEEVVNNILNSKFNAIKSLGIVGKNAIPTGYEGVEGVYIRKVLQHSISEKENIRPTDIITGVNNITVRNMDDLGELISIYNKKDSKLVLRIWRNGEIIYSDISVGS